jgi:hypothetical protein
MEPPLLQLVKSTGSGASPERGETMFATHTRARGALAKSLVLTLCLAATPFAAVLTRFSLTAALSAAYFLGAGRGPVGKARRPITLPL